MPAEMKASERPISEQYRYAKQRWTKLNNRARGLSELKSVMLERKKKEYINENPERKVSDSEAEREVKASDEWQEYINEMIEAQNAAAEAIVEWQFLEMRHQEMMQNRAEAREERRMQRFGD